MNVFTTTMLSPTDLHVRSELSLTIGSMAGGWHRRVLAVSDLMTHFSKPTETE